MRPNDPRFDELWGLENIGQTGGLDGADIKNTLFTTVDVLDDFINKVVTDGRVNAHAAVQSAAPVLLRKSSIGISPAVYRTAGTLHRLFMTTCLILVKPINFSQMRQLSLQDKKLSRREICHLIGLAAIYSL